MVGRCAYLIVLVNNLFDRECIGLEDTGHVHQFSGDSGILDRGL